MDVEVIIGFFFKESKDVLDIVLRVVIFFFVNMFLCCYQCYKGLCFGIWIEIFWLIVVEEIESRCLDFKLDFRGVVIWLQV